MPPIRLESPAKLNLVLDLIRKRADGYHDVEIIMQEVEMHDTLSIEILPGKKDIVLSCSDPTVPLNETNTCYKAALLMQEECKKQNKPIEGVSIYIEKKIPRAGGLGGGSSNGATVLKGLNQLWNLQLSKIVLKELAARVGSDVPYFIEGGTCKITGRGEIVLPIENGPVFDVAFIVPSIKVPEQKTRWIFRALDLKKISNHPSMENMHTAIRGKNIEKIIASMGNVFEHLDLPAYEVVFHLIAQLNTLPGVKKAMLAGAGPTVVAVCENEKVSSQIIEPFRAMGWTAFATKTV